MTEFVIANMAPIIFASMVLFLLIGFPVSFALAANGIFFGFVGIELGLLGPQLFQALPDRIFGIMNNDTLLAIPFFTFMGLILERSGMAEDLLDTIGQLFGPLRGGLVVWPVRLLVPIGFFLLVIQSISELIKRIGFLQGRCPDPSAKSHQPTPEEELALAIKAQKGEL